MKDEIRYLINDVLAVIGTVQWEYYRGHNFKHIKLKKDILKLIKLFESLETENTELRQFMDFPSAPGTQEKILDLELELEELKDALIELVQIIDDPDYTKDVFTTQPAKEVLIKFGYPKEE